VRRWAAATTGAALLLAGSCTTSSSSAPSPGPGGGPIEVRTSATPAPGDTLVLSLSADDADQGSACAALDEWVDGGWRSRWFWERSSPAASAIPDGEERTCPSPAVALPTEQTVTLPSDLRTGTWRLAYVAGEDDIGSYVFEVG
jgi:hypothetical protein